MILTGKIERLRCLVGEARRRGRVITLVPTMGAIHKGHLALIRAAGKKGACVVVSIFVNPTQFGPKEDYNKYPRSLAQDKKLLKKAGVDIIFCPSVREMYPAGFSTYVTEQQLANCMCGLSRPGHFRGVTTVVLKLFNIVQPDAAFFGRKDYQQAVVIKKMTRDLNLPVKIAVVPTVRDSDGLALSSRNKYLSPAERKRALILYKTLRGKIMVSRVAGIKLDYFMAVDKNTLSPVSRIRKGTLLAIAGRVGKTRLIDNIMI